MSDSIFTEQFNMAAYIRKRALEIENLEERALYKEVTENLMLNIYQHNQDALNQLEKRVFDEVSISEMDYCIYMGLTDRSHYDATDPFLFPIFQQDVEVQKVMTQDIRQALEEKQEFQLYNIYVQGSYLSLKKFAEPDRKYYGVVKTLHGEYRAVFSVEKDKEYLYKLNSLYHSFVTNNVPWTTVCTAHLQKRFIVSVCSVENLDPDEEVQEIKIDFEEFKDVVQYDVIPVWNIEMLEEKSSTYPIPCEDKINYEHRVYKHRLQEDCQYLVANAITEVVNVRRLGGDLVITGPIPIPHTWQLYKLNPVQKKSEYGSYLLSNERKNSFTGGLSRLYWKQVRSRAEIARIIEGFYYGEYLLYNGIELGSTSLLKETYDMDNFIEAELSTGNKREVMCLVFSALDSECYLNYDVMSFLVTQVQASFPEYYCIGRLS